MRKLLGSEIVWFAVAAALLILWTDVSLQILAHDASTTHRVMGGFWSSGWAANRGFDPYAIYPLVPPTFIPGMYDINLNPPSWLPLFQLVALGDPDVAVRVWVVAACALFIVTGFVLLRYSELQVPAWRILCMLLVTPVRDTIWLAQNYGLLLLCAAVGWIALKRGRMVGAAIAIGTLAAMKPNFLLWPAFLFITGYRRVGLAAGGVFAAWSLLPVLLDGPGVYLQWLHVLSGDRHWIFPIDITFVAICHRAGVAWLGAPLAVALILGCAYNVWRRPGNVLRTSVVALCAAILAAPLAWGDYAIVLLPALLDGMWGRLAMVAGGLLMVPIRVPLSSMVEPVPYQILGGLIPLLPVCIVLVNGLAGEERKYFFFEKKKQKTSTPLRVPPNVAGSDE